MQELKINGTREIDGVKFNDIEGGFGENKKSILAKDIANIHGRKLFKLNQLINNNRTRFKDNVDIIDLKTYTSEVYVLLDDIFTKAEVGNAKNIYLLSERGYAKLLKIMDDDLAWDKYDKLVDEYFSMREQIKQISEKDRLLLQLFSKDPMVVSNAHKQLVELEKKPLLDTIEEQKPKVEYHDNVLNPTDLKKLVTTTAIAKDMGTTAKKLNEVLHNLGIQYKQSNSWYVTTKYAYLIKDGYADYVINQFGQILKWSEEGRKFIIDTLKSNNYLDANGTFNK